MEHLAFAASSVIKRYREGATLSYSDQSNNCVRGWPSHDGPRPLNGMVLSSLIKKTLLADTFEDQGTEHPDPGE
jgi:hypothetical protein